ncbi:DUF2332 family protein [Rhodomicrobium lacus]|uniref:DUF2332 family protein n=1 Tax=Rhodomicrobium lacus TaxID=2498452 RepID=UPI0026E2042E|nr:DUF2332 family protein [Rhodomicrobium lacus]WKW50137.1 DUF2332 family protein [Rhodomicrobium lacus]
MNLLGAAIVEDLDREIAFAQRTSPFYSVVFSAFRDFFAGESNGAAEGGLSDILQLWKGKVVTAWFERPLLLSAALHRVALADPQGQLGRFYATCGGRYDAGDETAFREAILATITPARSAFTHFLTLQSLQTNEISRGLTWLIPSAAEWTHVRRPVVLVELGCSAGLNLMADSYGWSFQGQGWQWSQFGSLRLEATISADDQEGLSNAIAALPLMSSAIRRRIGCDLHVPDVSDGSARSMLEAMIWGDNEPRLARLRQGLAVLEAARTAGYLELHQGSALEVVPCIALELSRTLSKEHMVVFFNTVVTCYFDDDSYQTLKEHILAAALGPLRDHHVLWIEHEPVGSRNVSPAGARRNESVITVHRPTLGALTATVLGYTEMHPRTLHFEQLVGK